MYCIEPLESRCLLSLTGPHSISITVFNDLNRNGMRNSNEPGLADWGVIAFELRDAGGNMFRGSGRTGADGTLVFSEFIFDEFEQPSARVYIEPNRRFFSTTHQRATSGWFGIANGSIQFGLTDVAPISGKLVNSYQRQDGITVTTPLAGRLVFEDANRNGRHDSNEKSTLTDLEGNYTLSLRTGTHMLRVQPGGGFTAVEGTKLARSAVVYPYEHFYTFRVTMINPVVVDVLAAYTPAAGQVLRIKSVHDLFQETNRIYANSNTNVQINLKGLLRTRHSESGSIETDLKRLQRRGDGFFEEVHSERDRIRADLVVLLTSRSSTDGDVVGLAYQFSHGSGAERFGFSVATVATSDSGITLAHEIGHNLGAGHDAATASEDGESPLEPYAQGYRFRAGADNRVFKDIMSYGSGTTLPFFSTPNFKWLGKPIGRADSADNARIVREIAPLVAEYR